MAKPPLKSCTIHRASTARRIRGQRLQPLVQTAIFPPPLAGDPLAADVGAYAVLLAVQPHAHALRPVGPRENTRAVLQVVLVLAVEQLPVRPLESALAVHPALHPLPYVRAAVRPGEGPLALQGVLDELAGVLLPPLPRDGACAVLTPVHELAPVLAPVDEPLPAGAVLPALDPVPVVPGAVGLDQLAVPVRRTRQPAARVRRGIGPALGAGAVGLVVVPHLPAVDAAERHDHVLDVSQAVVRRRRPGRGFHGAALPEPLLDDVLLVVDVAPPPLIAVAATDAGGHARARRLSAQ
mmetsp:Transcript_125797/g.355709  ORF Transcript_125797/g.355709 Transcript_125797/m.355709 type:complete len:295 (-) Transcript_125797:115-999(-)